MNYIPSRLRAARDKLGMSQTALARKAGFQPSAISHFETGEREPGCGNLVKLAKALEVSADYIIGIDNMPVTIGLRPAKLLAHYALLSDANRENLITFAEMLGKAKRKAGCAGE